MSIKQPIEKITIQGFKSIRKLDDFPLRDLNVLIGANGSGKSNFVDYFRFFTEMIHGRLQLWTQKQGGADRILSFGVKSTERLVSEIDFGNATYRFVLEPTLNGEFVFVEENFTYSRNGFGVEHIPGFGQNLGSGHKESIVINGLNGDFPFGVQAGELSDLVADRRVYHFHDTSDTAGVKRLGALHDNEYLRSDASNLAAFLYKLEEENPSVYARIRQVITLAIPFFDDFVFRPQTLPTEEAQIRLLWRQKGSDYSLWPSQLSDGSVRFICLVTALLQPEPPATIIIDEPELGLHPYAITLLGALIRSASSRTQVIISTQSVSLLNEFSLEDLIVVELEERVSIFKRLNHDAFATWLSDYSIGELWEKNIIGGTKPMIRVHIICEGVTEETFIKEILQPVFQANIQMFPALLGKPGHKGGNIGFERLQTDLRNRLLGDRSAYCTTMFDFYALPTDFPGKSDAARHLQIADKAASVSIAMKAKLERYIGSEPVRRFIPYVQMYEFEALLFSEPSHFQEPFGLEASDSLIGIRQQFPTPEHINDNPQTAPSKRIQNHCKGYEKPLDGSLIAMDIGLETMRRECLLFNQWLDKLSALPPLA